MKKLKDLNREEKIKFLKAIQNQEINVKTLKGVQPWFLMNKHDVWQFISKERKEAGIPFTDEAMEATKLLKEAMERSDKQDQQSINQ